MTRPQQEEQSKRKRHMSLQHNDDPQSRSNDSHKYLDCFVVLGHGASPTLLPPRLLHQPRYDWILNMTVVISR